MSLPSSYSSTADYLKDALTFLNEYQWIFNFPNSHVLVENVFNKFPSEWIDYFKTLSNEDLNKLPLNGMKQPPHSFQELLDKIDLFRPNPDIEVFKSESADDIAHNSGLVPKKRHELIALAPLINKVCVDARSNIIIETGSGLGHLSHYLHSKYSHKVLGIECSQNHIDSAYKSQKKRYPGSKSDVVFVQHCINANSTNIVQLFVREKFNSIGLESSCLVGLHACADLSVISMNLFIDLDCIKSLIIVSCCYHRLLLKDEIGEKQHFRNFPVSTAFKDLFQQFDAETFLRRPFLRLACQDFCGTFANMSDEDHTEHARNLLFRGILQIVAESENCQIKRLKQKSGNPHFEEYLNSLPDTHELKRNDSEEILPFTDERFLKKMHERWKEYEEKRYLADILLGLQASIQSVCENIVLIDRMEYLKEKGYQPKIIKVDNMATPRCFALIAMKDGNVHSQ